MPYLILLFVGTVVGLLWFANNEFKRGVRAGWSLAEKEKQANTSKVISNMGPAMQKLGLSEKDAEDTALLMDAAQRGVENMMAGGMREKGEEIEAPKRTQWRGETIDHDKFKPTDPSLRNLGKGIHRRIEHL